MLEYVLVCHYWGVIVPEEAVYDNNMLNVQYIILCIHMFSFYLPAVAIVHFVVGAEVVN